MFNHLKQSPRTIKFALFGYVMNIIFPLVFSIIELKKSYDSDEFGITFFIIFLVYGFAIWLGEHMFSAKNWARLIHAIIGFVVILSILVGYFSSQELYIDMLDVISILISLSVIVLTYTPSANIWYKTAKK